MTVFVLLVATNTRIGLTWDEPAYFAGANAYLGWFSLLFTNPGDALSAPGILTFWRVTSEHPPLDMLWSGLVWTAARHVTDDLTAHRLGNMIVMALLTGVLFRLVTRGYGRRAGFAAVAALLTMPRFFFHGHLAALDVPAAFSALVVTAVFWRTRDKQHWRCDLVLGLLWGLALAVKINAVFVPVTLALWCLLCDRRPRLFVRLMAMPVIAVPVFLAVWPWMYVAPLEHLGRYLGFVTTTHWKIGQYYLGEYFMPPPWHFPFVMLWAVTPLSLTLLYGLGIMRGVVDRRTHQLVWLLALSALLPVLVIAAGQTMVYDNERLLMVSFPFLAGLAGIGFDWLVTLGRQALIRARRVQLIPLATAAFVGVAFGPQLRTMWRLYPHYLSYYSEGVGGLRGATQLGLETTYWSETYNLALPFLNERAQPNDVVWCAPWSHDVLIYYQTQGWLRRDLVILGPKNVPSVLGPDVPRPRVLPMQMANWYVVQHRQTTLGEEGTRSEIAAVLASKEVVYEQRFDDVPLFTLYR